MNNFNFNFSLYLVDSVDYAHSNSSFSKFYRYRKNNFLHLNLEPIGVSFVNILTVINKFILTYLFGQSSTDTFCFSN